jgi:hypothetical protein
LATSTSAVGGRGEGTGAALVQAITIPLTIRVKASDTPIFRKVDV